MKGKYLIIILLAGILAVVVFRMMKFEESLRKKRIVEVLIEDEKQAIIESIPLEKLARLSSTANYYAMVDGDYFKVLSKSFENEQKIKKWNNIFLKGVNLGVAMPGHFPTEFSLDFNDYLQWLKWIGEMNANVIRTYTILPPAFYEAFAYYNLHYHKQKLYLLQGVWAKAPPGHDYFNTRYTREFQKEIKNVIDILHGNAVIKPKPGNADGVYISDISEYVIGIILGREWEPVAVDQTNSRDTIDNYTGNFISVHNATPMELWLGQMMEFTIHYETQQYQSQRPVSFVNWLPLDPMFHMFEYIESEEINEFDNDLESVDFAKYHASDLFQPGIFASYHVYPYYPDFIFLDKKYDTTNNQGIRDNYFAYLKALKNNHPQIPLVIAEYGLPSSRGNSHYTPYGFHQGGHHELEQAKLSKILTEDILETGCAGAIYFEWVDEWFKFNWLVMDFEQPQERRKFWHNMENPEQNFGIIAVESRNKTIDGQLKDWENIDIENEEFIHFDADAAYFYLCARIPQLDLDKNDLYIAIDTYDEEKGDHKLPKQKKILNNGYEFIINVRSDTDAAILVDDQYSIYTDATRNIRPVYSSKYNKNGLFINQLLLTNRQRFSLTGDSSQAIDHNRSPLLMGNSSDPEYSNADWYWNKDEHILEIRLTWHLLNVSDPSKHHVLDDKPDTRSIEYTQTDGFNILYYVVNKTGKLIPTKQSNENFFYKWESWEDPDFSIRKKPIYDTLQSLFRELELPQIQNNSIEIEASKEFEICDFYNDKKAAISLIFSNSCYSQYENALPILEKYKLSATFEAVHEWLNQGVTSASDEISFKLRRMNAEEFKSLVLKGHEAGIRFNIPDSVNIEKSIIFVLKSQKKDIEDLINSSLFLAMNTNISSELLNQAGISYSINGMEGKNSFLKLEDNNQLSLNFHNHSDPDPKILYQHLVNAEGRWVLLNYRHIFGTGTKEYQLLYQGLGDENFTITPALFEKQIRLMRNTNYWIAPVSKVYNYLKQKDKASIITTRHDRFVFLTLKCEGNQPMTIRYTSNNKRIKVSNSFADGIYQVRDNTVLINTFPNKEITIEILE